MKVITIGRSSDNDVVIPDDHVSRHHLQIIQHDDGSFSLSDSGSTNGTFVNGQRVHGRVPLRMTDVVRIGNTPVPWQQYFGPTPPPLSPGTGGGAPGQDKDTQKSKAGLWVGIGVVVVAIVAAVVFLLAQPSQVEMKAGTTYSYTQTVRVDDYRGRVTSWFVFSSPTEVVWLMGVDTGNMFPVGFGKYYPGSGIVSFASSHRLNKRVAIFYGVDSVAFRVGLGKQPTLQLHESYSNEELLYFYNYGNVCTLVKEPDHLLKNDLAGTTWEMYIIEENADDIEVVYYAEDKTQLAFLSEKEVLADGEVMGYVYIGNMVAIKTGDDLDDENVIGLYEGDDEMRLCRKGLEQIAERYCFTLRRVQ